MQTPPWDPTLRPDIALLIALPEEFRVLADDLANRWFARPNARFHGHDFLFVGEGGYRCVATILPRMGPTPASQVSARLLELRPAAIVNLGIAGSFKKHDLRIGDVIVPRQVDAYDETGKQEKGWQRRGEAYRPDPGVMTAVQQLEFAHRSEFTRWVNDGAAHLTRLHNDTDSPALARLTKDGLLRDRPAVSTNHLASGSFVVASKPFAEWLREANGDIHAGEMEAAGMMAAAEYQREPVVTLVIRGISDHVDANKSEVDAIGGGGLRRLAMENTWRLACTLMRLNLLPRADAPSRSATPSVQAWTPASASRCSPGEVICNSSEGDIGNVEISYRIARGWAGVYHLLNGAESLFANVITKAGRLIETPVLSTIRAMRPLVPYPEGESGFVILDGLTLQTLGAPVNDFLPASKWMRSPSPGIDPSWWLSREVETVELGAAGCAGDLADEFFGGESEEDKAKASRLRNWMIQNLSSTRNKWVDAYDVQAPVIRVNEINTFCLQISGPAATHVEMLSGEGTPILRFELDGRTAIIPIGITFDRMCIDAPGEHLDESEFLGDPSDESESIEMPAEYFRAALHESLDELFVRFRGAALRVNSLALSCRDARREVSLRGPRKVWDCINVYFSGASCPEVFLQIDNGPWRHIGPVLVGADSSARTRAETHRLAELAPGSCATVVIREVPGEVALIRAELRVALNDSPIVTVNKTPCQEIGPNDVLKLCAPSQLEHRILFLVVEGYFIRLFQ